MDDDLDLEATNAAVIVFAHVAALALLAWLVCKCCCCRRTPPPPPGSPAAAAEPEQLQRRKRVGTAYLLWLAMGPLGNAHLFYLGRATHGVVAIWTINLVGLGWLSDLVLIPCYVRSFNSRYASPCAERDRSCRGLLCRLPLMLVGTAGALVLLFSCTPWLLHRAGALDLDRLAAQTELNPYEVLGLRSGDGLQEAKRAYRQLSRKWHPDHNADCGHACENKMAEMNKAMDLIKRRQAPPPEEATWKAWFDALCEDWGHVFQALSRWMPDEQQEQGQGGKGKGQGGSRAKSEL